MSTPTTASRLLPIVGVACLAISGVMVLVPPAVVFSPAESRAGAGVFTAPLNPAFRNVRLLENGVPLPRRADLSTPGGGYHVVVSPRREIVLSTSDGSDPRSNGRSYEVIAPRTDQRWYRSIAVACALIGAFTLLRGAPRARPLHAALLGAVPFLLTAVITPAWHSVEVHPDSRGYVEFHEYRSGGYPWFVALTGGKAVPTPETGEEPLILGRATGLLTTARAQKVVGALSLVVLGIGLARGLGILTGFVLTALASYALGDSPSRLEWSAILSEPLSTALVMASLGVVACLASRPRRSTGLLFAAVAVAAAVVRPNNVVLLLAFPILVFAAPAAGSWRRRVRTLLPGAVLAALLLVGYMGSNAIRIGYFGFAPFMQFNLMGNTLEIADPGDVASIEDPAVRRFVDACLRDAETLDVVREISRVDRWIYHVASPNLPELIAERGRPGAPWYANRERVSAMVNRTLVLLHPWRFAGVVVGNVIGYAGLPLLVLLSVYALWLSLVGDLGARQRAFVACCAVLPLASLTLYSVINLPTRRYMVVWLVVLAIGVGSHVADLVGGRRGAHPVDSPG